MRVDVREERRVDLRPEGLEEGFEDHDEVVVFQLVGRAGPAPGGQPGVQGLDEDLAVRNQPGFPPPPPPRPPTPARLIFLIFFLLICRLCCFFFFAYLEYL